MKHKADLIMAVFLTACLLPALGMLLLPETPAAAHQVLAPAPAWKTPEGRLNPNVFQELSDYVGEHFAFRQELITCHAWLQAQLFHSSSSEKVLLGKDDWLFYRETLEDALRTAPLSERQLWSAARTLSLVSEYADSQGARLLFTAAPNKASLYPQYLPAVGDPLSETADIDRLRPLLAAEGVSYVDLFRPFRNQEEILYYQLDSHWNTRGAALAADTLLAAMGISGNFFNSSWTPVQNHRGDLYEMLYPVGRALDADFEFGEDFHFQYDGSFHSPEDQLIRTASEAGVGRLLVYRDSFGNALYPFLAEHFQTAVFSRSMPWDLTLLEESGADTVLIEIVERNLDWLATRAPVFPAPLRQLNGVPPEGEAACSLAISDDGLLPGCVRIDGRLSGDCDPDSPIYIQWDGVLYEASPVGEDWDEVPFTLYVPAGAAVEKIYYQLDGALLAAADSVEENG